MLTRTDLRSSRLGPRELAQALPRAALDVTTAQAAVAPLIEDVRSRGAAALRDAAERFDGVRPVHLRVPAAAITQALNDLDPSVREALRILNALGLIRSSSGSGPKSGAIVISEPSDTLSWALRMHIATRNLPVKDVVSTRLLLEGPAARAAANAPDSPERDLALENAREHLREMDLPQVSNEHFHFCDTRFHYELSKLGGNIVLDTVIDSLHMATISYVQEAVPLLRDWDSVKQTLQDQHRGIYEAISHA